MTYQPDEKLIYDNTYPVRFVGSTRDEHNRLVSDIAVVSEDGVEFFARLAMLRRPLTLS